MSKKIYITTDQLKTIVESKKRKPTLKEEVEGNIITSVGNTLIEAILKDGVLYDENYPGIEEPQPTLVSWSDNYTIYVMGDTNGRHEIVGSDEGDYYTAPYGGDIEWKPTMFYPEYVYGIYKGNEGIDGEEIDEEYEIEIGKYIIEKLPKSIPTKNYEIVVNSDEPDEESDWYDDFSYEEKAGK